MEDNLIPGQCIQCREKPGVEGYPMPLCTDCRDTFNKYPVPKWIWAFAGVILLLMLAGFTRMPKYLETAVHLRRAEKAVSDKRYLTAGREADKVLAKFPDLVEANGYKLVSTLYNSEFEKADSIYDAIKDREISDKSLLASINEASERKTQVVPEDSTLFLKVTLFSGDPLTYTDSTKDYTINDIALFGFLLARQLSAEEEHTKARAVLEKALSVEPEHYLARLMLITEKRLTGDYAGALTDCDALLALNKEDIPVMVQKCKVYFAQNKQTEAAKLAKETLDMDPDNVRGMEVVAMAEHFAGKKAESNKLLAKIRTIELAENDTTITNRLSRILDGTDQFR